MAETPSAEGAQDELASGSVTDFVRYFFALGTLGFGGPIAPE